VRSPLPPAVQLQATSGFCDGRGPGPNVIGPDATARVRRSAIAVVGPIMGPYRPLVVFLSGRVPENQSRPEVADAAAVGRRHPERR
jgi:hypothetical protein